MFSNQSQFWGDKLHSETANFRGKPPQEVTLLPSYPQRMNGFLWIFSKRSKHLTPPSCCSVGLLGQWLECDQDTDSWTRSWVQWSHKAKVSSDHGSQDGDRTTYWLGKVIGRSTLLAMYLVVLFYLFINLLISTDTIQSLCAGWLVPVPALFPTWLQF